MAGNQTAKPSPFSPGLATALFLVAAVLFFAGTSFAETKKFVKEYTYKASAVDNEATSRVLAIYHVSNLIYRDIAETILADVKSEEFPPNATREEKLDELATIIPGAVWVNIAADKWDHFFFYMKAEVDGDPSEIAKTVDKLRQNEERSRLLKDVRFRQDGFMRKVASTRKINDAGLYNEAVIFLSSTEWFIKGLKQIEDGHFDKAAFSFDYAIERDPENANAWEMKGWAYYLLGNYKHAIEKFDEALARDSNLAKAYEGRGMSYGDMGDPKHQIEDLKIAARLNSKSARKILKSKNLDW